MQKVHFIEFGFNIFEWLTRKAGSFPCYKLKSVRKSKPKVCLSNCKIRVVPSKWVSYKFTEVVNLLTDENGFRHTNRKVNFLIAFKLVFLGVSQKLQSLMIKIFVVLFNRVKFTLNQIKKWVNTLVPIAFGIQ
jgi:hypothetical protein